MQSSPEPFEYPDSQHHGLSKSVSNAAINVGADSLSSTSPHSSICARTSTWLASAALSAVRRPLHSARAIANDLVAYTARSKAAKESEQAFRRRSRAPWVEQERVDNHGPAYSSSPTPHAHSPASSQSSIFSTTCLSFLTEPSEQRVPMILLHPDQGLGLLVGESALSGMTPAGM
jgi:hypothetical protein